MPPQRRRAPILLVSFGWKWFTVQLLLLAVAGLFGFFLGMIITIKRDGHTYQVEAPDGSRTTIDSSGNATVDLQAVSKSPATGKTDAKPGTHVRWRRWLRAKVTKSSTCEADGKSFKLKGESTLADLLAGHWRLAGHKTGRANMATCYLDIGFRNDHRRRLSRTFA